MTPNTPQENPAKTSSALSLLEKRDKILTAWGQLVPDVQFAEMSTTQFYAATTPSDSARTRIADARARISSLVSERMDKEEVLRSLLRRIVGAVRCSPYYGENSQLYRAMGFIPVNERKAPRRVVATDEGQASSSSRSLWDRYEVIHAAWEKADGVALPEVTLAELKAAGAAVAQIRSRLLQEQTELASLVGLKKLSDETTSSLVRKVVASVICSKNHGMNSPLYRAMGYIPMNERKRSYRRSAVTPL